MFYNVVFTEEEIFYLSSKKIARNNLLVSKNDLVNKIDSFCECNKLSFSEAVFIIINNIREPILCKKCKDGKPKFISTTKGYKKYCSTKCSNSDIDTIENKRNSCLEKYGVDNPSKLDAVKAVISNYMQNQSEETKEKRKKTNLEKWGHQTNLHTNEVKKKRAQSYNRESTKEKRKKTNLERWGFENPNQNDIIKNKIVKTNLERWGVEYPLQNIDVKNKAIATNIAKWGVDNPSKVKEIRDKAKKTTHSKFGVEYVLKNEEVFKKMIDENIKKWGVAYYTKTEEYREKRIRTNNEKWGVDNNVQNDDFRKENYKIAQDPNYIGYSGDGLSLFWCEKGHEYAISSDLYSHRRSETMCTICNPIGDSTSLLEKEIYTFIKNIWDGDVIQSYRDGQEIDIYIPDLKIGFEFNGLYWHCEKFKDKYYHIGKTNNFKDKGIAIKHIWEDDWASRKDIIKSQICSWIGLIQNKIYARNCMVKEIENTSIARNFLDCNHIQGFVNSHLKLGLYYNGELVSMMSFDHSNGRNTMLDDEWNLNRFCNKLNTTVVGGASKLFKYFLRNYNPKKVISYADLDWSTGNLYYELGFNLSKIGNPDYKYFVSGKRVRKQGWRKKKLIDLGWDVNMSESEIMNEMGIYKIWDCGKMKFEMILPKKRSPLI